jgi:hypothetical protein
MLLFVWASMQHNHIPCHRSVKIFHVTWVSVVAQCVKGHVGPGKEYTHTYPPIFPAVISPLLTFGV